MPTWPSERSRHGGADRIPLPIEGGGLWLCGKHYLGPDVEQALRLTGATTVVCLSERHELEGRYPDYVAWLRSTPHAIWHPIPDLHAPEPGEARDLIVRMRARIEAGDTLLMHCGAGIGRAGTMAAAVLVTLGLTVDDAIATVAAHRPMAGPEAGAQRDLLLALAAGG